MEILNIIYQNVKAKNYRKLFLYKYKEYIINYLKLKLSKFAMFPNF